MKADEPRQNRIPFMMSDAELAAVDEWRFKNKIGTRAEAIRRLCQIALETEGPTDRAGELAKDLLRAYNSAMVDDDATADSLLDAIATPVLEMAAHTKFISDATNAIKAGETIEVAHERLIDSQQKLSTQLRLIERFMRGDRE